MDNNNASGDAELRIRATFIKEERPELVKRHLWVLWTDYFKVDRLKQYPNLHDLFLGPPRLRETPRRATT